MSEPTPHTINIDDLDTPLFRFYPLWFFEEALRARVLVLVPPQRWDDPWESIAWQIAINRRSGQIVSGNKLKPVYAQCWSATHDSDTLLRAYSHISKDPHHNRNVLIREEGVRIRTTPRKIMNAIIKSNQTYPKDSFYLGRVDYLPQDQIGQLVVDSVYQMINGSDHCGGLALAKLLLLKRPAFAHENEYRVVYIEERNIQTQLQPLIKVSMAPNELFDEVTFDPRLEQSERNEREEKAVRLGYSGTFGKHDYFDRIFIETPFMD